jgi:hypothetical protein
MISVALLKGLRYFVKSTIFKTLGVDTLNIPILILPIAQTALLLNMDNTYQIY